MSLERNGAVLGDGDGPRVGSVTGVSLPTPTVGVMDGAKSKSLVASNPEVVLFFLTPQQLQHSAPRGQTKRGATPFTDAAFRWVVVSVHRGMVRVSGVVDTSRGPPRPL